MAVQCKVWAKGPSHRKRKMARARLYAEISTIWGSASGCRKVSEQLVIAEFGERHQQLINSTRPCLAFLAPSRRQGKLEFAPKLRWEKSRLVHGD